MDHKKIEQQEIVDRYILGKLSPEEEKLFEEHFFGCDQCFNAVKEAEKVIFGIKDAAERGVLVFEEAEKKPAFNLLEWLKSFTLSPAVAVATAVLVLALLYPAWQGIVTVSRLKGELEKLHQPQANVQTYYLEQSRAGEQTQFIEIPSKNRKTFVLNFNILEKALPTPEYRAEIIDQNEKIIWRVDDLQGLGEYEIFTIVCPLSFFMKGIYTLKVYEINPQTNQIVNEFLFNFKIN